MKIGVYRIINKKNNKFYVGSSVEIEKCLDRHKRELKQGKHHCIHLQRAWYKYGSNSFEFQIIIECLSEEEARDYEQYYLDNYKDFLYNTSRAASGGDLISYHPNKKDIVKKMTSALKKRYKSMSPEERKKVYGSHKNGMTGKTHTPEIRKKLSEMHKGNSYAKGAKRTPEQRARLSEIASKRTGEKNPFFGRKHSEETKKKIAEMKKGLLPSNTKPVVINGVEYKSSSEAARQLGVAVATISNRIRSDKFPTYKYLET